MQLDHPCYLICHLGRLASLSTTDAETVADVPLYVDDAMEGGQHVARPRQQLDIDQSCDRDSYYDCCISHISLIRSYLDFDRVQRNDFDQASVGDVASSRDILEPLLKGVRLRLTRPRRVVIADCPVRRETGGGHATACSPIFRRWKNRCLSFSQDEWTGSYCEWR